MNKFITPSLLLAAITCAAPVVHADSIVSMTIQDVTGDTVSGAFRFSNINLNTYAGTSNFNSNGEIIARIQNGEETNGSQLPGASTDGAILFGQAQDINQFTQGFYFLGDFKPSTLSPPEGSVEYNDVTARFELDITSLDFAGLYNYNFLFPLGPDANPAEPCTASEMQTGGICVSLLEQISPNQYNYRLRWSHIITPDGDPTSPDGIEDGSFTGFNARWVLEGVITTSAVPVPAAIWLFGSGLLGLVGLARARRC
jgi:hypothetical protein